MDTHSFIDFLADKLPSGISPLHRVQHEGYAIGRYLLNESMSNKLGSPQLMLTQREGKPFTIVWHPMDEECPTPRLIEQGQIHVTPPDRIIDVSWFDCQQMFIIALDVGFIFNSTSIKIRSKLENMPACINIQDTGIVSIIDIIKEGLERRVVTISLTLACALLAGRLLESLVSTPPRHIIIGGLGMSRQQRVLTYIEAHLHEDLDLKHLAAKAGLSPDHFGRAFRASLGTSPLRYIAQRRLHRAKTMLLDPGISITDIAMALGFATPSHFTSNFHKATGTTPSQWRRDRR